MAALTVQNILLAGAEKTALTAAASGGDTFVNDGKTILEITNGDASPMTLTITGQNCIFKDVVVSNYGNNAACLAALTLSNYGCSFERVSIQGTMTTNQCTTAAAASLYIDGAGMYPVFQDCIIGQDVWGERSGANSGVIRFTGTAQPNGGRFHNCRILSRSDTATCAAVALPANGAIGRGWTWLFAFRTTFNNTFGR